MHQQREGHRLPGVTIVAERTGRHHWHRRQQVMALGGNVQAPGSIVIATGAAVRDHAFGSGASPSGSIP